MTDIKKLWEICLKTIVEAEALKKEVELLHEKEKALKLACSMIADRFGTCPGDIYGWKGCLFDGCQNEMAECWQRYFVEKARGE